MLQKWAVVLVLVAVSIAVVFIGLYGRQAVLKANPCQMTYSKREKSEVPLCGKNCEHKLWKISNPSNKNLNPQPVLYIPGHLGRYYSIHHLLLWVLYYELTSTYDLFVYLATVLIKLDRSHRTCTTKTAIFSTFRWTSTKDTAHSMAVISYPRHI